MRLVAFAIALAIAHPAFADRRINSLANDQIICVHALTATNEGRTEVAPYAGTSLGGELYREDSWGGALRYQLSNTLVAIVDARSLGTTSRLTLPVAITSDHRVGAGSTELGYVPFLGKLVAGNTIVMFDVVTSIGPGVVVRADEQDRDTAWLALSGGAAFRVYAASWLTAELGVHDDYVPWEPVTAAAPRTTASRAIDPAKHDIEVRAGLGMWWPSARRRGCVSYCY